MITITNTVKKAKKHFKQVALNLPVKKAISEVNFTKRIKEIIT